MKRVAVILSGSGVFDGSEIHEAVLTLLAIDQNGGEYEIFAPDKNQHHVINHITGEEMNETRNVLTESARIARGAVKALSELNSDNFDALIIPGGFGAAKNLSTYAFNGPDMNIDEGFKAAVLSFHKAGKPIGGLCITPIVLAKIINGATVTLGNGNDSVAHVDVVGGKHKDTSFGEVVYDKDNNLYTTPCYMLDGNISEVYNGASNIIKEIFKNI
ncbi:MAG: isoprenoid biosynthesis glyoxalase ElbB [Bacteroidales bacterium]|jgi:enhancing lycopene biosynthesis protein 2|nr:isoprenoid biosynthesis glyoxalase ElbB [Bacteroidales bacterium]